VIAELVVASGVIDRRVDAWSAGCWITPPTDTQKAFNRVDLVASTHQWLAARAVAILRADGFDRIASFFATPDPSAPVAHPQPGTPPGTTESFEWRLLEGADDADCVLQVQVPDHLHNFWTHKGSQMIVGSSAASYAEKAFAKATSFWRRGDRANAMLWLGASLHLVQDSCVPQHGFFGVGINHVPYEEWVRAHQDALAANGGAILTGTFRAEGGHGGPNWSSAHPRGWADECAHHAAAVMRSAFANVPKVSSSADPQWRTASHIAFTQRLGAGYLEFFFRTVGAP
jgi:hypothetical protein